MPSNYVPRRYKANVYKRQNATVPLKDDKDIDRILLYFLRKREHSKSDSKRYQADRNWMICLLGFNFAFRAEDLLQLMPIDIKNGYVSIKELKTGKVQNFKINKDLFEDIKLYWERNNITDYDYMFVTQVSHEDPITRQRFDDILRKCREDIKLAQPFSMHSLRKTFAYQYYIKNTDLVTLQKMLNHKDAATTLIYICWSDNDMEKAREGVYNGAIHRKKSKRI